jgi:uncharacterized protein YjbI with pentapeptide repeats
VEALSQDSSHIEILRRGPRAWNAWRSENPEVVPNLSGLTLSVGERQMGPINGGPINLSSTRLRHASLRFATLTGADLSAADLWDADLSDARLDRANLSGADLTEALLDRADFACTKLVGANLSSASLLEARNLTQALELSSSTVYGTQVAASCASVRFRRRSPIRKASHREQDPGVRGRLSISGSHDFNALLLTAMGNNRSSS